MIPEAGGTKGRFADELKSELEEPEPRVAAEYGCFAGQADLRTQCQL